MAAWSTRTSAAAAAGLLLTVPAARSACPCSLDAIRQRNADALDLGAPTLSADGRFVAFASRARLLPAAAGTGSQIYVFDVLTQTLTLESPLPGDSRGGGDGRAPGISGDGRFLVFEWVRPPSDVSAPADPVQIVLRDRRLGTTRMLSVNGSGRPGDHASGNPVISADGRVVAFDSAATNLIEGVDANGSARDVYVVVLETGALSRASLDAGGSQREGSSFSPALSADGRYVAFTSEARLDEPSTPHARANAEQSRGGRQVFVRDLGRGITQRVSRRRDGREPNGSSFLPSISGNGRWVAFVSNGTDIAGGHTKVVSNIYLHDRETSTTTLVSRGAGGAASDGASTRPALSGSGRFVAFESEASNLVCGKRCGPPGPDINLLPDVFLFDREDRSIVRLSSDPHSSWMEPSRLAALDADGRIAVFASRHPIADDDTGNDFDLFVARLRDPYPER